MSREFDNYDRFKSVLVRDEKRMEGPIPDYPKPRKPRQIVYREDGKDIFVVDLRPHGRCTQWLATFPNKVQLIAGMVEIHAEIRRQMPPLLGIDNL